HDPVLLRKETLQDKAHRLVAAPRRDAFERVGRIVLDIHRAALDRFHRPTRHCRQPLHAEHLFDRIEDKRLHPSRLVSASWTTVPLALGGEIKASYQRGLLKSSPTIR